ncbi:hypothetical protein MMC30_008680 [Trapelia coarctata]|nr:hypothetical protein [Trapelia coarctata]
MSVYTNEALQVLLKALDLGPDWNVTPDDDVSAILKIGSYVNCSSRDLAVTVMQSHKLHKWITCGKSSFLNVHGHIQDPKEQQLSGLSYICAKLIQEFALGNKADSAKGESDFVVIPWFCGKHLDLNPVVMMRNLIAQLLVQLSDRADLGRLWNAMNIKRDRLGNHMVPLCDLFLALVHALPEGTVLFCIVDGISHYNTKDHHANLFSAIHIFVQLSNPWRHSYFKLLVTMPWKQTKWYMSELFQSEEILNIKSRLQLFRSRESYTPAKWDASIGKAKRALKNRF